MSEFRDEKYLLRKKFVKRNESCVKENLISTGVSTIYFHHIYF